MAWSCDLGPTCILYARHYQYVEKCHCVRNPVVSLFEYLMLSFKFYQSDNVNVADVHMAKLL